LIKGGSEIIKGVKRGEKMFERFPPGEKNRVS